MTYALQVKESPHFSDTTSSIPTLVHSFVQIFVIWEQRHWLHCVINPRYLFGTLLTSYLSVSTSLPCFCSYRQGHPAVIIMPQGSKRKLDGPETDQDSESSAANTPEEEKPERYSRKSRRIAKLEEYDEDPGREGSRYLPPNNINWMVRENGY